jgi:hypothetical protein
MKVVKPLIYVGSPYSHKDKEIQTKRHYMVSNYVADLNASGQLAFSPITYGLSLIEFEDMPSDWGFWSSFCISFLNKCDALHVLKFEGWDTSEGLSQEISYAESCGMPIEYIDIEFNPNKRNNDEGLDGWVMYLRKLQITFPKKYGRYLVKRRDGKIHFEVWNGTQWAYNNDDIVEWKQIK